MSKPKFKVGDIIKCIKPSLSFSSGAVYTVLNLDEDGDPIVVDDRGDKINEFSDRFELVSTEFVVKTILANERGEWVVGEYMTFEDEKWFALEYGWTDYINIDEFKGQHIFQGAEEIKSKFTITSKNYNKNNFIIQEIQLTEEALIVTIVDEKGKLTTLDSRTSSINLQLESNTAVKTSFYRSELSGEFSLDWNFIFNHKEKITHE